MTVMQIQNSKNVTLDKITYSPNKDLLLRISGNRSKDIKLINTDTKNVKKAIEK